jgi:hypothetical protein
MLIFLTFDKERRLFSQSASHAGRQHQTYVSIRTVAGESIMVKPNFQIIHLTAPNTVGILCVIRLILSTVMCKDEILEKMKLHIWDNSKSGVTWFSGLRKIPRIHQWDEQELPFATFCWIDLEADSPAEANLVLEEIINLGLARRHQEVVSTNAAHVFAYASN